MQETETLCSGTRILHSTLCFYGGPQLHFIGYQFREPGVIVETGTLLKLEWCFQLQTIIGPTPLNSLLARKFE